MKTDTSSPAYQMREPQDAVHASIRKKQGYPDTGQRTAAADEVEAEAAAADQPSVRCADMDRGQGALTFKNTDPFLTNY